MFHKKTAAKVRLLPINAADMLTLGGAARLYPFMLFSKGKRAPIQCHLVASNPGVKQGLKASQMECHLKITIEIAVVFQRRYFNSATGHMKASAQLSLKKSQTRIQRDTSKEIPIDPLAWLTPALRNYKQAQSKEIFRRSMTGSQRACSCFIKAVRAAGVEPAGVK
jgi:hypothetical protein